VHATQVEVLFTGEGVPSEAGLHGTGNTFAPNVHVEDGQWRMWYGAQGADGHDRIHYAESADGRHWVRQGVVLEHPESNLINDPWVMRHDGGFRMYYTVAEQWIVDTIHLAESDDGIHWTRRGEVLGPGAPGGFDALLVGRPCVVRTGDEWRLYYDGRRDFPYALSQEGRWPTAVRSERWVGVATSRDGLEWERRPTPVLESPAGSVHVSQYDGEWLMLIESPAGTHLARGADGFSWSAPRPVLPHSGTDVDRYGHITPYLQSDAAGQPAAVYLGLARRSSWTEQAMGRIPVCAADLLEN
jgi:sucrose-6-phosphate hydrolase SacC (GH32 family)